MAPVIVVRTDFGVHKKRAVGVELVREPTSPQGRSGSNVSV